MLPEDNPEQHKTYLTTLLTVALISRSRERMRITGPTHPPARRAIGWSRLGAICSTLAGAAGRVSIVCGIQVRSMRVEDAEPISAAFERIGWHRPAESYLRYVAQAQAGDRVCVLAESGDEFAGYGTLLWRSNYPPFRRDRVPEINDLNVLPQYRRQGVGSALLDALEAAAGQRSKTVGLGVGLHAGYGAAQRLYVARGYRPDGRGVMYDDEPVEPGATIAIDNDATLMFTLSL
jgi:GNAT superfamily N-acetyltransferase